MPTSTKVEVPPALWALVHDLLSSTGMSKVAKSLSKKVEVELPSTEGMESLLDIFNKFQSDSGSSDKKRKKSSSVETESAEEQGKKKKKSVVKVETPSDEVSDDEEAAEPVPKQSKKKDKKGKDTLKEEQSVESPSAKISNSSSVDSASKKGASNSSPFQRVKAEEVTYLKVKGGQVEAQRLKDNTFESKGGDVFGAKASEILVSVRGKDFRHEKTKKKRSFRSSGPIDMNSNSVKFESDSE